MSGSRSVLWTITNTTRFRWTLNSARLAQGSWAAYPPQVVLAGERISFEAESSGFMSGCEGLVSYSARSGDLAFRFANPFVGPGEHGVAVPDDVGQKTDQHTGSDLVLSTRCTQSVMAAAPV